MYIILIIEKFYINVISMNYSTPEIVKSQRNIGLDIIRCFALLMIITVHTWSLSKIGDRFPYIQNAYVAFSRLGVPLFVMISGALQLSFKDMSIGKYYKKVFSRLLIPFKPPAIWPSRVIIITSSLFKRLRKKRKNKVRNLK